jgi:hypothetical protein
VGIGNLSASKSRHNQFDKTGLPDPLLLTYYFSVSGPRIEQLIIVMKK